MQSLENYLANYLEQEVCGIGSNSPDNRRALEKTIKQGLDAYQSTEKVSIEVKPVEDESEVVMEELYFDIIHSPDDGGYYAEVYDRSGKAVHTTKVFNTQTKARRNVVALYPTARLGRAD